MTRRSRIYVVAGTLILLVLGFSLSSSGASLSALKISFARIASGLSSPVAIGAPNDGTRRLFIVEQPGRVRARAPNGTLRTVLDISGKVNDAGSEQGMLGIAFHPQYKSNGYLFLSYTNASGALVVARFKASPPTGNAVSAATETDLLTIAHPAYPNHNGGQLAFGRDGYLYIGTGDGGLAWDPNNNAHDTTKLLGKILRLDVNRSCTPQNYCVPSSNPFHNEVWEYGLRNPWRFSFDRSNGALWIGDVGQNAREEIDRVGAGVGGKNFGWDCWEGTLRARDNGSAYCTSLASTVQPLTQYDHDAGDCAVIGGFVYRGSQYSSSMGGIYLYGDYCTGYVRAYLSGRARLVHHHSGQITSFGEDTTGELYVTDAGGGVYHIKASGGSFAKKSVAPKPRASSPTPTPSKTVVKKSPTPTASASIITTPASSPPVFASRAGARSGRAWPWIGLALGLVVALGVSIGLLARRRATGRP
jgi:glucose/arabinose dehydrogenase